MSVSPGFTVSGVAAFSIVTASLVTVAESVSVKTSPVSVPSFAVNVDVFVIVVEIIHQFFLHLLELTIPFHQLLDYSFHQNI